MSKLGIATILFTSIWTAGVGSAADGPPAWAYGLAPANAAAAPRPAGAAPAGRGAQAPPDTTPKTLPGSSGSFTPQQIRDGFGPADWFPGDHPTMPEVVAHGRRPDITACSLCHLPNGKGRA